MAVVLLCESNICRLCTAECDGGVALYESVNSSPSLASIINRYLPLKVEDNGKLPRLICQSCNESVKEITSYFDLLTTGQRRLRELWKEQGERLRKEKRTLESSSDLSTNNATNLEIHVPEDGTRLFDINHSASLAMEGREAPRRRPGRPRKSKPLEIAVDVFLEDPANSNLRPTGEEEHQPNDVDPEQALELMFKEAEEKRIESGETSSRTGRRRRVPQRFSGVVQGKELDTILKNEGVIGPEEEEEEEKESDHFVEDNEKDMQLDEEVEDEEEGDPENDENDSDTNLEEDESGDPKRRSSRTKKSGSSKLGRPRKRQFNCEYCGRKFLHAGHFSHHLRTRHGRSHFVCLTCNQKYPTKEELAAHQNELQHNGEGIEDVRTAGEESEEGSQAQELKCLSCNEMFAQQSVLTKHIVENHISEKSNICDLCGKVFSHSSSVIYHKEVAHSKTAHKCTTCGKGFRHKQLLQRHTLVHSDDRPFICHVCGATFKTRANLFNHSNIHSEDKPYQCTHCDAKFTHKTSLVLHTRWHTGEKPFQCTVCQKNFSQAGNLQEHMRIHTGEKPFACDVCSKRFTTSSQHKLHMKRHTGERPWKCEYCGKDFLHKDSWKCHLRRHRGEKPFSCPICSRTFTEQWALKKHVRLHTGEKPYSCNLCSKSFSDLSNLQKHKKTHKNTTQQPQVPETVVDVEAQVASTNGLSFMDGQHIIYVTEDQTQMLISTIEPEQAGLAVETDDAGNIESMMLIDTVEENAEATSMADEQPHSLVCDGADDGMLTIVGVTDETGDGQPHHESTDGQQQAVEFTTQDGNRVRLFIPADVDPYQFTADYLASLSEQ